MQAANDNQISSMTFGCYNSACTALLSHVLFCRFICISHSEPEARVHILMGSELAWELVEHVKLTKNKAVFHAYVLQKLQL